MTKPQAPRNNRDSDRSPRAEPLHDAPALTQLAAFEAAMKLFHARQLSEAVGGPGSLEGNLAQQVQKHGGGFGPVLQDVNLRQQPQHVPAVPIEFQHFLRLVLGFIDLAQFHQRLALRQAGRQTQFEAGQQFTLAAVGKANRSSLSRPV